MPTAPKVTGIVSKIKGRETAANTGNPKINNKGAVIAAGVPKPAIPSRKATKSQATIIVCNLESGVRILKSPIIVSISFVAFITYIKDRAPKIISMILKAVNAPFIEEAMIHVGYIFQIKIAKIIDKRAAIGIIFLAGHESKPIKIIINKIGSKE